MPNNKKIKRIKKEKLPKRYDRCFKRHGEEVKKFYAEEIDKSLQQYINSCGPIDESTITIITYVFYLNLLRTYNLTEILVGQRRKDNNFDEFSDLDFLKILSAEKTLKNIQEDLGKKGITPSIFMNEMMKFFAKMNKT